MDGGVEDLVSALYSGNQNGVYEILIDDFFG